MVTGFGTDRKPVYDFLLVNNINLSPISRRLRFIGEIVAFDIGHFTPNSVGKIWLQKLETSLYLVVCNIFRYAEPFRRGSDRLTCGQNYDSNRGEIVKIEKSKTSMYLTQ